MSEVQEQNGAAGARISALLAWRPLQSWQAVAAAATAVLLAAALTLVLTGKDPAAEQTYITSVTRGEVVYADGSVRQATIGARVPNGASVRTGQGGGARLTTDGRDVYVGQLSTVTVSDGVRQLLERGLVMVDARTGPALTLSTSVGAGTVSAPEGSLTRVEQNIGTLRLAVYDGEAAITAEGRRATSTVPALHQVRVPYGGVPEQPTALALTISPDGAYDPWEQRLAANLVQADVDLNSFANGLNGIDGLAVLSAAPVSLKPTLDGLQGRQGERALTVAVAQKARLHPDVRQNLEEVQRDRGDGGSWGVVAAIVRAPVTDVTSVLGSSIDDPANPVLVTLPRPRTIDQAGAIPTAEPSSPSRPTRGPGPRPTASPTTPVDNTVRQVTGVLPPIPTPPAPTSSPETNPPTVATVLSSVLGLLSPDS
jgi:hypothetical protein